MSKKKFTGRTADYQGLAIMILSGALAGFIFGLTVIGLIDTLRTGSLSTETGAVVLPIATGVIGIVGAYVGAKHITPEVMQESMKGKPVVGDAGEFAADNPDFGIEAEEEWVESDEDWSEEEGENEDNRY